MASMDAGLFDVRFLDDLSRQDTPVHRLDPRAKLLVTLVFLITVVSFDKYQVSALLPFFLFPATLAGLGNIPLGLLLKRLLVVSPFAVMIGLFNPFLDTQAMTQLGPLTLSGGWVSFGSILLRFTLTVGAALLLVAVTGFYPLCRALERLGTPRIFVVQLMFLYRYLFVLLEEAVRLVRARALRSVGHRGQGLAQFGPLVGHLLLRTLDRAQRIHLAMLCRGFEGRMPASRSEGFSLIDVAFVLGWTALFLLFRFVNLPQCVGQLVAGGLS